MSQTLLDFRRSVLLPSLGLLGWLCAGVVPVYSVIGAISIELAQAYPLEPPPVPQQQRPSQDIDNQSLKSDRHLTGAVVPQATARHTSIAAVTNPAAPRIPVLQSQPIQPAEDELIQQMSGKAPVATTAPIASSPPIFTPPSQPQISDRRPVVASQIPPRQAGANGVAVKPNAIAITSRNNSDVGLRLIAPSQYTQEGCTSDSCYNPQPNTEPVSSSPTAPVQPAVTPEGSSSLYRLENLTFISQNSSAQLLRIDEPETGPSSPGFLGGRGTVSDPELQFQGVYLLQGDESSARARLGAIYPLTPRVLFGATLDLTDGTAFADSRQQGLNLNELYLATSLQDLPNLRFVIGLLDLTSYFDRNSFAKDGATHFFNPVFQTNPALSATGIASRPGVLVNWSLTDNIEAKAAAFSSARTIGDFTLDAFAAEVGLRYGNAIIRGTYVSDRDAGTRDGFGEIFQIPRGNGENGPLASDREESYGVNAEVFVPNLKLGLFGRYGRYENRALDAGGDTYSLGLNLLDVFAPDDRLGIAYGRGLSNDKLRREGDKERPDVLEVFYDFRFLANLRVGLTLQERNNFSETILGFRVKTEFDVTPRRRGVR
ncbi:MAG: porin [Cyanobacteriota bacterium]